MNTQTRRFLLFTLAAVALSTSVVRPARAAISEQQEIEMGRQVSAQAQKEYGRALPPNNPIARRVRNIGMQIAALSDRKNIPYSYTVLQNDKILNAFAAPGGPVFVTTKLVSATSNDAELAYVIAHETGHIDRRHTVNQLQKQQQLGIFGAIAGAIFGRAGEIGGSIFGQLQSLKYSRSDENQADAIGVRFMSRLGYDPRAAITMLGKLGAGGGPEFLSDHPDTKSRIQTVRNLIEKEGLLEVARRAGGPRMSIGAGSGAGNANDDNTYPDETTGDSLDLGAPLRTVYNAQINKNTVVAPVAGFAKWAGAQVSSSGSQTTLRFENGRELLLRRNSRIAELDGQIVQMSVAVTTFNGILYAPMKVLADAAGATATIQGRSVSVQMSGRAGGSLPLP